ncbi:GIN domain-containing protein [Dyadobacter sp. CY323]|uniref:GIN domain-containing protein n=1 Tax=Dyadobacter sp. CY323 TaxID=2907302 RepID=UPI001F2D53CF|nr:DUF2807 domain-containing protein [Dyadobacter sp. CY323]MCE6989909.1 DUF2807 domain-containing protein [Dyadobacter sp. CY323]
MKTSNILLITLFSLTLLVLLGSNLVLKAGYDRIDKSDPLWGYRKEPAKPFKYVKLQGKAFGLTEISPGKEYKITAGPDKKYYDWKVVGDTLVFNYHRDWELSAPFTEEALNIGPNFYITAPDIKSITSQDVPVHITNWKSGDLVIKMNKGALLVSDNVIDNLNTDVHSGGFVKFGKSNNLGNVSVQVKDSSSLKVEKDIFKSFKANVDGKAQINLPGSLYKNVAEN